MSNGAEWFQFDSFERAIISNSSKQFENIGFSMISSDCDLSQEKKFHRRVPTVDIVWDILFNYRVWFSFKMKIQFDC